RALHEALPFGAIPRPAAGSAGKGLEQHRRGRFYRPCVVCGELMNRFNFGRVSGVIIDACRDHGIWFDAEALTRILDWIHRGGAAESEKHQRGRLLRVSPPATSFFGRAAGDPPWTLGTDPKFELQTLNFEACKQEMRHVMDPASDNASPPEHNVTGIDYRDR